MNDKETMNIILARLLDKDDENRRLRKEISQLQEEAKSGNAKIQKQMKDTLDELKKMRRDYRAMASKFSKAIESNKRIQEQNSQKDKTISEMGQIIESLREEIANLADKSKGQIAEILLGRSKRFAPSSEQLKNRKKPVENDPEKEKEEYDGENKPSDNDDDISSPTGTTNQDDITVEGNIQDAQTSQKPMRSGYEKNSTHVDEVVFHKCNPDAIPEGSTKVSLRTWVKYRINVHIIKDVFEYIHAKNAEGVFDNYYLPVDSNDEMRPFTNTMKGYPIDFGFISKILTDKYQYGLSLENVLKRYEDEDAEFSSSTVGNWVHKHIEELEVLDEPLRNLLLTPGSFLFCDETTEKVRVKNIVTGKMEYRKKYIWGVKNTEMKVAYYLYDHGSRGMAVAENFFKDFFGSILTDGYNVYKMFEKPGWEERIKRYGCFAHVRRDFVDAMPSDGRAVWFVEKIGELYWIEADCKIRNLTPEERVFERKRRAIPIIYELYQKINEIYEDKLLLCSQLLRKAVNYAMNEWKAVTRYVNNGKAEIDNNTAERMMKPICLGRNNYLFLGSEKSARHASLIYSLIETCKMNAVKPVKYLERVFNEISNGATNYEALLPMYLVKQQ